MLLVVSAALEGPVDLQDLQPLRHLSLLSTAGPEQPSPHWCEAGPALQPGLVLLHHLVLPSLDPTHLQPLHYQEANRDLLLQDLQVPSRILPAT